MIDVCALNCNLCTKTSNIDGMDISSTCFCLFHSTFIAMIL